MRVEALGQTHLDQDGPFGRGGEGLADVGQRLGQEVKAHAVHQLERADAFAQLVAGQRQKAQRGLGRGHHDHCRARVGRLREEFQRRGGDHAQRAFGSDEQVFQIVPGVVFSEPRQPVPDLAIGQHGLQPQTQIARIAITKHARAACVGGEVTANPRGALGGE